MSNPHSGRVNEISPADATRFFSGGGKQVCAWDGDKLLWSVEADKYEVNSVLAAGGRVVSAGSYGTLAVLDGDTGAVRHSRELSSPPGRLFALPDGRVAVADAEYEDLLLLDVETGVTEALEPQGEQGPALGVRASATTLHSVGPLAGACRWDLATRAFLGRAIGPEGEAQNFAGDALAFTTTETSVHLWQVTDGAVVRTVDGLADVRGGAASPDGERLAIRSKEGVTLIDVATGAVEQRLAAGPFPRLASFSPDGARLAVVVDGKGTSTVTLFDTATGAEAGGWKGSRVSTLRLLAGVLLLGLEDGTVVRT
jgi:WD40 repeat protein